MLKSKRKLIDIRLLPMAHLAIKIEAINNFHVALNLYRPTKCAIECEQSSIVYLNAGVAACVCVCVCSYVCACIISTGIIRRFFIEIFSERPADLISAIFSSANNYIADRIHGLYSGNTAIMNIRR